MSEQGQVKTDELDAQAEARRRLALAQIRQYPDPVLRLRANEVETFDEELARLAERMTQLMHDAQGIGLALAEALAYAGSDLVLTERNAKHLEVGASELAAPPIHHVIKPIVVLQSIGANDVIVVRVAGCRTRKLLADQR